MTGRYVLRKAVDEYGKESQLIMAMEEMSELIQALSKNIRGYANEDNVAEEIADVEIMLNQLKLIFNNEQQVKRWYADKVIRLSERL